MKVLILKTGEVKDFENRVAQRLVLQGKAKYYEKPVYEPVCEEPVFESVYEPIYKKPVKAKSKKKYEGNS